MIREHPDIPAIIDYMDEDDGSKTECNKDTGTRKKLQKWTRGYCFIVRGGGHIDIWQPLYQQVPNHAHLSDQHMHSSIYAHLSTLHNLFWFGVFPSQKDGHRFS